MPLLHLPPHAMSGGAAGPGAVRRDLPGDAQQQQQYLQQQQYQQQQQQQKPPPRPQMRPAQASEERVLSVFVLGTVCPQTSLFACLNPLCLP